MNAAPYSDPPEVQFRAVLARRDIVTPASLIADGKLHRCDAVGRGGKVMRPMSYTSMACRPAVFRTGAMGSAGRTGEPISGDRFRRLNRRNSAAERSWCC